MTLTSDDLRRYWANIDAAQAALQADAEGWAEYQWARQSWNNALSLGRKRSGEDAANGGGLDAGRSRR